MCLRRKYAGEELDQFNACKEIPDLCTCLSPCPWPNLNATAPPRRKGHKLGPRLFPGYKNRDGCLPARRKNVRLLWKLSVNKSWHLPALYLVGKSSCAFGVHVRGDTHAPGAENKSYRESYREMLLAGLKEGGGGKTLAVSVVCFQFGFIKNPQTNHPKNPTPNSSSELFGSKKKPLFITCVSSPCPSPQSLPLTKHLQDGNLLGCLFSTQVDKHIDRRVNAICCFREKWGPQTKWNCWSQARGSAPFPLQQTRARTSVHTCAPLPSNF